MKTLSDTITMVKRMYFPMSGIVMLVAGTISISSSCNIHIGSTEIRRIGGGDEMGRHPLT